MVRGNKTKTLPFYWRPRPESDFLSALHSLGKKIYQIIADLMELNVFANVNESVDFETASKVLRKYGYQAKKPGASPPPASL